MEASKFPCSVCRRGVHAQYVEEEWKETPFYAPNVRAGCIKDALK